MASEVTTDIISKLPPELRRHLLSYLPTRIAAHTSCLSTEWHDEFCRTSTLVLRLDDETDDVIPFIQFVNRIVSVRQPDPTPLLKFHLTLHRMFDVTERHQGNFLFHVANTWIKFALEKRVSKLTLCFNELPYEYVGLPETIFVSRFLVKLKICTVHHAMLFASDVNVLLPKLKSLSVDMIGFGDDGIGFYNLLRGCPVIEELEMKDIAWFRWASCSVSSSTLKILRICWDFYGYEDERNRCPKSVSFVTPKLVYLDYNDDAAKAYEVLDFASLVEVDLLLHLRVEAVEGEGEGEDDLEMAHEDASDFIHAIRNVRKLYLYADTLQVLAFGCHSIPLFPNLTMLSIESHHKDDQLSDWDSLPVLLNNSPNLHKLVFLGLTHHAKNTCGNMCRCEGGEVIDSSLVTSPVKVLVIYDLGQATSNMASFIAMVRHFLVTMPHVERFTVYCDGSLETRQTLSRNIRGIQNKASPMCRILVLDAA